MDPETLPPSSIGATGADDGVPGLVLVFARGDAKALAMPLSRGALEIGRGTDGGGKIDDGRISRRHATVAFENGRFTATDLGSQNGMVVDGQAVPANATVPLTRVLRVGDSLLVPSTNVALYLDARVQAIDGFVRGPKMQAVLAEVARAANAVTVLHVSGESGTGKEGIAQAFHRAGPRASGPFVAVNCAAIPEGLAERLLFGAKKGAFSGADHDASGYLQDADGGTLFLDEIGELDAQVQAKLLRALESREVQQLGASKARKIDIALCSATNKDLRGLVANKTLREDLYFRIGRPMVHLPPLRDRPEEIVALIANELGKLSSAPSAHVTLVEQCLLRPWPGNVRELVAEVRVAAHAALAEGDRVMARHLSPTAGSLFATQEPGDEAKKLAPQVVDDEWREKIIEALRASGGNVTGAARALGLHRTQLRRLIEKHGIAIDEPTE